MKILKLSFPSGLHVESRGSGEPDQCDEFIHSDTLSAALCISWSALHGKAGPDFFLKPPFIVSSAFPFIGSTLFFPVPVWHIWQGRDFGKRKEIKKVRWLSRDILDTVLQGKKVDFDSISTLPGGLAVSAAERKTLVTGFGGAEKKPWQIVERQRIRVDRLGLQQDGGLFFFAQQFFAPQAGLYFVVNCDENVQGKFRAALDFLSDSGLGGDRNSGVGHFTISDEQDFSINRIKKKAGWLTLSLLNPAPEEQNDLLKATVYNLTSRSGWISNTTLGRPPIQTFSEGSFFRQRPKGRVVEMISEKIREEQGLSHSASRDFRPVVLPCVEPDVVREVRR